MNLMIKNRLDREIIHFYDGKVCISSIHNWIFFSKDGNEKRIKIPGNGIIDSLGFWRIFRRLLRLDKCNIVPVKDDLVIIRQGKVYFYNYLLENFTITLSLKNCRNVLHQSITKVGGGTIFFGEYGNNPQRASVPIYRSDDGGKSWNIVFSFPRGKVKHVHGCYWDPFEEKIWVFTGDFSGECFIIVADKDFREIEWIGNGQQVYRACNAFFTPDSVHWVMDSQLEASHHIRLDRKTRKIERLSEFPGPVWYIKHLNDGVFLAATAQEIGTGVLDDYAHIFASTDLITWKEVFKVAHDGLPKRWFKFGVIGFADGSQSSQDFTIFCEALKKMDGKSFQCKLSI